MATTKTLTYGGNIADSGATVVKTGGTITNATGGTLNPGAIALDASGVKWGDPATFYFTLGGANNSELVLNYRNVIPEPGMLGLLALGAAALAARRRRG